MINIKKLLSELRSTGISVNGISAEGIVWDDDNNEIQDRPDVKAVIAKHDPTPEPEETLDEKIDRIVQEKVAIEVAKEITKVEVTK